MIDGATNATATVTAGNGVNAVAVNPVTNKIYVANQSSGLTNGIITVIDGATNTPTSITSVGGDPNAIGINPVTNKIYVANQSRQQRYAD